MQRLKNHQAVVAVAALSGLAVFVSLAIVPRLNPPPPEEHSYYMHAGSVSRAIISDKWTERRTRRRVPRPRLPQYLEFESSTGEVEIYVVPFDLRPGRESIDAMQRLTEELQAGQPPQDVFAKGSGKSGRIVLHRWPYGRAQYLMLVRSAQQSEVSVVVHY